jgi:hypothetical protein
VLASQGPEVHPSRSERKHNALAALVDPPHARRTPGPPARLGLEDEEPKAVLDYFLETLGRRNVQFVDVARVDNPGVRSRFRAGCAARIMFHGCRSQENEDKILQNGFQVSHCVSGGRNYGTWFAYNASYSDGGFAHVDSDGVKHLFLNIVSDARVVQESAGSHRVVAQDCAYPVWLVRYRDICPGNCDGDYDYDYESVCTVYYYGDAWKDALEAFGGLSWKTLREAQKATGTLRESRRRAKCQAKRSRLGCMAETRRGRRGQPLKRGGRHKVSSLILQVDECAC